MLSTPLLITPLILMSFHNKLVWFKCPNCLMEDIPVAAARIPVSVLPASYWFCCWTVPLSFITSCGACCSYWLVRALFSCCSLELMSCLLPALWPSNFSAKKQQILQSCFPLLRFLIHIFHEIFVWFLYSSDQLSFVWYVLLPFSVYSKLRQR